MQRVAVPLELTREAARPRGGRLATLSGLTMGVSWSLRALAPPDLSDEALRGAVQGACDLVVVQMSTWEPDSLISQFNRAEAGTLFSLPPEMAQVLACALDVAQLSDGAFDPTVGGLVDCWGFGAAGAAVAEPPPQALAAAAADWRRLDVRDGGLRQTGGVRLDLSGIAKGFGVDLASRAVEALGVRDYLIEIGGELRGAGVKGDGEPWWVAIENPPGEAREGILVALHGLSIATSGDWRRNAELGGRRVTHTIDPATRFPIDNGVRSVTVLHRDCMLADAFCTALSVLGDRAATFAAEQQIAAQILWSDGEWISPRLQSMLS